MPSMVTRGLQVAAVSLLGCTLALAPQASFGAAPSARSAANPNPHVSGYVSSLGTTIVNVNSDSCAGCHRAHTAQNTMLLPTNGAQSDLCFTCHDGTGATTDVKTEYVSSTPNDPSTASYYKHDATLLTSSHTLATDNEFGGVLNRHVNCTDCHNPHSTTNTDTALPTNGVAWPISGRMANISFVSVDNTTTPYTFTFNGGIGTGPSYEYQVCFKCHSSFTTLPTNSSGKPSQDMLDVAAEFDPANVSFHPIEAAGKNTTAAMANSLAGPSGYKLFTFTTAQTVRCTNCHADDLYASAATTAASNLPAHTSTYRGILVQNYQDRLTNLRNQGYNASNFALCYTCHTDTAFKNGTTSENNIGNAATNFKQGGNNYHRFHMTQLTGTGSTTNNSIDSSGAGGGSAMCAECHFRPHSTESPVTAQASNKRLVNFAPNVQPNSFSAPRWTVNTGNNTVSCDLVCHGQTHDSGMSYTWTP